MSADAKNSERDDLTKLPKPGDFRCTIRGRVISTNPIYIITNKLRLSTRLTDPCAHAYFLQIVT
jgi:hypothetical protein